MDRGLICWLDLETTGTDERAPLASILEIGVVLTTADPSLSIIDEWEAVVHRHDDELADACDEYVTNMHKSSGLWDLVTDYSHASPMTLVRDTAQEWLNAHHPSKEHVILAGSGVGHFDSRWLAVHMPDFRKRFTYWSLDVGVLRRWGQFLNVEIPEVSALEGTDGLVPHRALDDAYAALAQARWWVDRFGALVPA